MQQPPEITEVDNGVVTIGAIPCSVQADAWTKPRRNFEKVKKGKGRMGPLEDDDEVTRAHYGQLWDLGPNPDPFSLLVWVEKTLALPRNFAAADCYPLDAYTTKSSLPPAKHIPVSKELFAEILAMAEAQGIGHGRGRGGNQKGNKIWRRVRSISGTARQQVSGSPQWIHSLVRRRSSFSLGTASLEGSRPPPPWFTGPYSPPDELMVVWGVGGDLGTSRVLQALQIATSRATAATVVTSAATTTVCAKSDH